MPKFTPGPWKVLPLEGKYYGTRIKLGDHEISIRTMEYNNPSKREIEKAGRPFDKDRDGFDHVEDETCYANACLISAAPEMLSLLKYVIDCLPMEGKDIKRIKQVIAKAEGNE